MMTTVDNLEDLTIANLFSLSPERPNEPPTNLDASKFKAVEEQAKGFAEPVSWSALRTPIASKMTEALTTKVIGGWVSAWQTWEDVKEKVQKSRHSPAVPFSCTLMDHTI